MVPRSSYAVPAIGRCACGGTCPRCQANAPVQRKLAIGEPDDPLEREADRVADQVMRMPAGQGPASQNQPLQSNPAGSTQTATGETPGLVQDVLRSPGEPLDEETRAFMEPRFGADFSGVRVHTDANAAESAQAMNALAYTAGRDIVLDSRRYGSKETERRRLLAHELTHVLQQARSPGPIQRLIRTPYPWQGVITPAIGAHVRSAADASDPSNILDSIPTGQIVTVVSASGDWLWVQSHYRGPLLEGYIHHTLVDDAASRAMAGSVGATMVWRPSGPGSGTNFETWASAATETPFPAVTSTTVMNCWEAVLLSAYRAGAINWTWIHNLYVSTPFADWATAMSRGARHSYAVPGPNLAMPQRGDIVFFDGMAHVALATGNGSEVYTFWPPPNTPFTAGGTTDKMKIFTIEALVTWWAAHMPPAPAVEFAAPNW